MNILQVNKFFKVRGGSETVFFETINGLRERGHEVSEFSTEDKDNLSSVYSQYFVSPLPALRGENSLAEKWRIARRMLVSSEVERKLTALIKKVQPAVAHLHNVYRELSASTFLTLKKLGVPTVLTVHDVFPLCPNHSFVLGETLAEAKLDRPYKCVANKCINDSLMQSLVGAAEAYYYRARGIWKNVDRFICPSVFMKNKLVEYGFPADKMRIVMNPCSVPEKFAPLGKKIVFLGRLHVEKGIRVFMRAVKDLKEYQVVVAGDGPEASWVDQFIKKNNLINVERRGWVDEKSREKLMAEARVVAVPSIFFDVCSESILEALASGRLVVASDRGGNQEMVMSDKTGWLVRPEDPTDLARAIREAMTAPDSQVERILQAGRALVQQNHNLLDYLNKIEAVYSELV